LLAVTDGSSGTVTGKKAQKAPARSLCVSDGGVGETAIENRQKAPARSRSLADIFAALRTTRRE
jgi:hypothetical protein